jgi:hypothetical protein
MTLGRIFLRLAGAGAMLSVALAASAADVTPPGNDHAAAVDTLSDIRSAIAEITRASSAPWSGPEQYKASSRRALVILEGDDAVRSDSAASGGAMGRIEHLLDRQETLPWEPVMEGALANLRAATLHLQDAGGTRSLDDYTEAMSLALENLEVAQGRPDDPGVLGGVSGALANTALAVPPHAKTLDGCRLPHEAGYGVHNGYLAYRAVPLGEGRAQAVPLSGGENVRIAGNLLVIYTAAAPLVKQQCEQSQ